MSTPIEIANDIKAAILELAGGRDYPDLLEAVDSLLIRSSNKGYAQGVIDGKAIGSIASTPPPISASKEAGGFSFIGPDGTGLANGASVPITSMPAAFQEEIRRGLEDTTLAIEGASKEAAPAGEHVCGICFNDPERCDIHDCGDMHSPAPAQAPRSEPRAPVLTDEQLSVLRVMRQSTALYGHEKAVLTAILAAASQAPATKGVES